MGTFGPIHWLLIAVVLLLLFGGRGKITGIMGDTAKGIRAFRDGLKGDDEAKKGDDDAKNEAKPLPKDSDKDKARQSEKDRAHS